MTFKFIATFFAAIAFSSVSFANCKDVLIKSLNVKTLDYASAISYLSIIDKQNYDKLKTDYGGKALFGLIDGEFEHMKERIRKIKEITNLDYSQRAQQSILTKRLDNTAIDAWIRCQLNEEKVQLTAVVTGISDNGYSLKISWIPHTKYPSAFKITEIFPGNHSPEDRSEVAKYENKPLSGDVTLSLVRPGPGQGFIGKVNGKIHNDTSFTTVFIVPKIPREPNCDNLLVAAKLLENQINSSIVQAKIEEYHGLLFNVKACYQDFPTITAINYSSDHKEILHEITHLREQLEVIVDR